MGLMLTARDKTNGSTLSDTVVSWYTIMLLLLAVTHGFKARCKAAAATLSYSATSTACCSWPFLLSEEFSCLQFIS
jgi:hypothetical protein